MMRIDMDTSLTRLLQGFETSVVSTLAKNDVRTLEDARALSLEQLKELGFSVGMRNRLHRRFTDGADASDDGAPRDGNGVSSCGASCLRFALDDQPQACAPEHRRNRTTAAEAAALANPSLMDVAPLRLAAWAPPRRHAAPPDGLAVATALYQARNTSRFTSGTPSDTAPCAALAQMRALRALGGLGPHVDYVVVHAGLLGWQLKLLARHGIKLHAGRLPPAEAPYPTEYERAMLLKVDVLALTQYARVLFLDVDMYPRRPIAGLLSIEYEEVTAAGGTPRRPLGPGSTPHGPNPLAERGPRPLRRAPQRRPPCSTRRPYAPTARRTLWPLPRRAPRTAPTSSSSARASACTLRRAPPPTRAPSPSAAAGTAAGC